MNQQQKELTILNHAAEELFKFLFMCVHRNMVIDFKSDFMNKVYRVNKTSELEIYGGSETPVDEPLRIIFELLRNCICKNDNELWDDEDFQKNSTFLEEASKILNEHEYLIPLFTNIGERFSLSAWLMFDSGEITRRPLLESAIRYINILHGIPEDMRSLAPVGVCPQCNGIFKKKRTDQRYCSKKCKFASWADGKGNKYFAEKARNNRQAKKRQEAAKKRTY